MTIRDLVSSIPEGDFKEWVKKHIVFLFCVFRSLSLHDDAIFLILDTFGYLRDLLNPVMVLSINIEIPLLPHNKRHIKKGNLWMSNLSVAYLSGAYLYEADLSGAYLSGAYLSRADLAGADLTWTDLSRADLSRANLFRANFSGANLRGADLAGAILEGAIALQ